MQHLRPSGAKSVGDKATSPSYAKEMSWLSDKSSRGSYASATWSTTVAAGSENENKDSGNDDLKSDLTTNNGQDEPEPLSHDDTADKYDDIWVGYDTLSTKMFAGGLITEPVHALRNKTVLLRIVVW